MLISQPGVSVPHVISHAQSGGTLLECHKLLAGLGARHGGCTERLSLCGWTCALGQSSDARFRDVGIICVGCSTRPDEHSCSWGTIPAAVHLPLCVCCSLSASTHHQFGVGMRLAAVVFMLACMLTAS